MARIKAIDNSIKYTVVLPKADILELKNFTQKKIVSSVNAAVREAVEEYITKLKSENYKKELIDAVNDSEFLKRVDETMKFYQEGDSETEELMNKW